MLNLACSLAKVGTSTNEIDAEVRGITLQFQNIVSVIVAAEIINL